MAYDLSNMKVKNGQNWSSPKEIHKIANDYYLYAPVGASGGLAIKNGVPYYVTLTWSGEVPTITLGDTLAQIGTNKSSISSLQESVSNLWDHSLLLMQSFVNGQTYELYGGRKFSDYTYLIAVAKEDGIIRAANICTRNEFAKGSTMFFIDIFHDMLDSTTGLPKKMSRIGFIYVDDKHVSITLEGSQGVTTATLLGIRLPIN